MDWFPCGIGWFSNGVKWRSSFFFSLGFLVGSLEVGFFEEEFSRVPNGEDFLWKVLLGIPIREGFFGLLGLLGSSGLGFFGEGFSGLLGLLGSSRLGFFGEGFSCLLAGEVFLIFSIFFVGLALDGGLIGVSFLL